MPPPTNSDGELEVRVLVMWGSGPGDDQRLTHFYPRGAFVVDGITYDPRLPGCLLRPMVELRGKMEG